jgi:hypothetical protein
MIEQHLDGVQALGYHSFKARRSGQTMAQVHSAAETLRQGKSVAIMDDKGPAYKDRVVDMLLKYHNITVTVKDVFGDRHLGGYTWHYGEMNEVYRRKHYECVVVGYSLRMIDIDNDWHPNETF